ncbi:AAA family ATPase [Litoribacillus peritrichatus]|uniref:histidine kinase n=1 Tax=Litoribacillus peritrichatus TaxID=718191 RepID=A0ABP7N377_9GAMM
MHLFKDYELKDQQQHSDNKIVFDAVRISDQQRVQLNYYQTEVANYTNLPYINNTFNCLKAIQSPYLLKIEDLVYIDEGVAIVTEPYLASSLKSMLSEKVNFSLIQVLTIIVQVSTGLKEIHSKKISHQAINPSNITFDPENNKATIVDYGISQTFLHKEQSDQQSKYLYISPEQTGRMNRSVDHRSDLYSLGVVFYKLLTNQCPFQSNDILELIHAHIAQQPPPPHKINNTIPETISKIVMKLLCKEAEKRYQSAAGLNADIFACLEKLQQTGQISRHFEIGAMDLRSKFQIPEKLYGRNHEIQLLLNTFENSAAGNFETVIVGGYSGVGKSALINEIQKPLVAKRGLYTQGKYDQFKKAQPYSAILQALTDIVRQILTKQQNQVDEWADILIKALNGEGQCLVEVLPILEALISKQPELEKLNSVETQARFNRTCEALVKAFSSRDHPFILFLDDLQWADLASLNLIDHLIKCQCPYMMLIMAYRDNEVDSHHPFTTLILHDRHEDPHTQEIALQPITLIDIQHLVSETLHKDIPQIGPLAQELMLKTQGNPFFLGQLFSLLYQDQLVMFDPERGWQWDMQNIQQARLSSDVVILMTSKLKKYSQITQSALNMGGILGAEFQIHLASLGLNQDPDSTYLALLPAIQDGLLKEQTDRLKFAHDKIHESSYALMPKKERTKRHALVAKFMLETFDQDTIEAEIFTIVEHLNNSSELITQPEQKLERSKYNYQAGIKAKQSSAFEPAVDFLLQAKNYLDNTIWQHHPDYAYDLHYALAQAAYTTAKFELSENIIRLCLDKVQNQTQIPPLVQLYQDLLFADSRHEEGIHFALNKLKEYGLTLPAKPSKFAILKEYFTLKIRQGLRPTETLIDLPQTTNPKILDIIAIIANMVPSCYMINGNLMGLISLRMANLSLKYGNNIYSSFGFAMTGLVETGIFKRIQSGRKYYDLSYAIEEKYPNKPIKGRNMMLMSSFAGPWTEPISQYKQLLEPARALNAEQGILQWSDFCVVFTRAQSLFFGSDDLTTVYHENEKWLKFHIKNGDQQVIANQKFLLHFIQSQLGSEGASTLQADDPDDFSQSKQNPQEQNDHAQNTPSDFDEEQHAAYVQQQQNVTFEAYYAVLKQLDSFMSGDHKKSVLQGLALFAKMYEIYGIGLDAIHRHIYALAYLALDKSALTFLERIKSSLYFKLNQFYLWVYQNNRPDNFAAHYSLLKAELYKSKNRQTKALGYFENAIHLSQTISLFNEALSNERFAEYHMKFGRPHSALLYAVQAKKLYKRWGNHLQVDRLIKRYPELALLGDSAPQSNSPSSIIREEQEQLDLMSLTRGSQAISSEVQLDQLITALLKQLIQSAGAERAILLFEEYDQLHIQGIVDVQQNEQVTVLSDQALPPDSDSMAETVIRFVERSKTCEVLNDAVNDGNFTQDTYIIKTRMKSLLCMPILNQGKLLGILYLENNLVTGAFTQQHQDVLQILASQAAISIVNARLYAQLEDKVAERTQELQNTMDQLIEAEKMASLGQLVSGVAHEINTPVGIGVTSSTLMQHKLEHITKQYNANTMTKHDFETFLEQSNEVMDMLLKSINHIAELVTRFKTISVDQSEEQKSRFYVYEYILDILDSLSDELNKNRHIVEIDCPKELEMQSYPLAFSLIISTLVSNSIHHGFNHKKGGKITIQVHSINDNDQDEIHIEYYDNGVGIKEEHRKKIFDPFFTTNMGDSTGLGLHIIYNVITQQFGGSIRCEPGNKIQNMGAHFYISLPRITKSHPK